MRSRSVTCRSAFVLACALCLMGCGKAVPEDSVVTVGYPLLNDGPIHRLTSAFLSLQKNRRYSKVEDICRRFIASNRHDPKAIVVGHYYLAHALMSLGLFSTDRQEGQRLYKESLSELDEVSRLIAAQNQTDQKMLYARLTNELVPLWRCAVLVHIHDQTRRQEGLELARRIIARDPDTMIGCSALGFIEQHASETGRNPHDLAKELVSISEEHAGSQVAALALYRLSRIYKHQGDQEGVRGVVGKLERLYPGSEWAEFARRELDLPTDRTMRKE